MSLPAIPSPNSPTPPLILPDAFRIAELEERVRQLKGAATLLKGAGIEFPTVGQAAQYLATELDVFHEIVSNDQSGGEGTIYSNPNPVAVAAMSGIIGSDLSRVLNGSLVTQLEEKIESLKGPTMNSTENGDSGVTAWEEMTPDTTASSMV